MNAKPIYLLLLTTIALSSGSCAKKRAKQLRLATEEQRKLEDQEAIATIELPINESFEQFEPTPLANSYLALRFSKTPCYGNCPVYSVEIYADGKAIYQGSKFAPIKGARKAKIPQSLLQEIYKEADKIGFWDLNNTYPKSGRAIPDLPTTTTLLRRKNQQSTVANNHDAPARLFEFEQWLSKQLLGIQWSPVN